ncbi:MAG: YbaL family putative K(+) efflux transporter [Alphaproteobacteria bacterium]
MPHDTPLIWLLVVGLGLAFVLGTIAVRLRLSPLAGYLIAGVIVGPFTPGFVADANLASELAEIGVILLMFGVGLHFSPKDLMSVRAVAVPATFILILATTAMGALLGVALGWGVEAGIVLGLALSVASTVVALRVLQEKRLVETERGRLAVGWLVVEDLVTVLAMVLLPTWAHIRSEVQVGGGVSAQQIQDIAIAVALTLGKVAVFIALMLVVGKRVVPWVLHRVVHMGSRELFRLAVLSIALGVAAAASAIFDISFALGALFAGIIMAESELSAQAAQETLPLRDAFAVLFFVSVGMLFDPMILLRNPLPLLATVAIIIVFRTAVSAGVLMLFKQPRSTSLIVAASRAQIGEFSFILAGLGVSLKLMPEGGRDLVLGGAIISIVLNPLVFWIAQKLSPKVAAPVEPKPVVSQGRAVLIGYGRVGSIIGRALDDAGAAYVVIEDRQELIGQLQARGISAIAGNAVARETMEAADITHADLMFVTVPDGFESGRIVELARSINPKLKIFARAHSDAEVEHLRGFGADLIISGEREIAEAMIQAATRIIPRRVPATVRT